MKGHRANPGPRGIWTMSVCLCRCADVDNVAVVDEGSDCGRDDVTSAQMSSGSSSSSSSSNASDSDDSDALMVSQELRPGFSSDRDVSGRHVDDNTGESEVLQRRLNLNGSVDVTTK